MVKYRTIATDLSNNDIYLDGVDNLAMSADAEAIANIILNRQRTALGELQYNTDAGIPYFSTVFAAPPDMRMFEAFIIADAETVPGVVGVESFSVEVQHENVRFEMYVNTEFGRVAVNG